MTLCLDTARPTYVTFGAHPWQHDGVNGVQFCLWAPHASSVCVVGDFNRWNAGRHPMNRLAKGCWHLFVAGVDSGMLYKFAITTAAGRLLPFKADPVAFAAELRPGTASRVTEGLDFDWADSLYCASRRDGDPRSQPISIYEVHPGSWDRGLDGGFLAWDDLADRLIPYAKGMGFTHIELTPVSEYPYDPSWGYQTTGLYAPTARFGPPEAMARFVDAAHNEGMGVILDWVPAHFPYDPHGLSQFDGQALYEYADPRLGHHPDWNSAIYDFGRREVVKYLVDNAIYWIDKFHVDGLRVDAVASMLYRDYSRPPGEWVPNSDGGNENWEAVNFLRTLNQAIADLDTGAIMMAEESSAWPSVTKREWDDGLGFDFKWNMGFMHDALRYMGRDPEQRASHSSDIISTFDYLFNERFILPVSHDEVVHEKGTLIGKMAGEGDDKFANLSAYLTMMWAYPGKKLLFMGQEFAQLREWNQDIALDWDLLGRPHHVGIQNLVRDLNATYRRFPALHRSDCNPSGFRLLLQSSDRKSLFSWARSADLADTVVFIVNFSGTVLEGIELPLTRDGPWPVVLASTNTAYGGPGGAPAAVTAVNGMGKLTLQPLEALLLVQGNGESG